jgi:hypothetical protein
MIPALMVIASARVLQHQRQKDSKVFARKQVRRLTSAERYDAHMQMSRVANYIFVMKGSGLDIP